MDRFLKDRWAGRTLVGFSVLTFVALAGASIYVLVNILA
jgi:hypothetical protein